MPENSIAILTDAIARRAPAVLSLPSSGALRNHRTRFLGESHEGFWMEAAGADRELVAELMANSQPAAVSFRAGVNRAAFTSTVLKIAVDSQFDHGTVESAVLLAFPADIRVSQRRNHYRVCVSSDSGLTVRAWRIGEHAHYRDRPLPSQEIAVEPRNLSAGGMSLRLLPKGDEFKTIEPGERLRLVLSYGSIELLLEARLRHSPAGEHGVIDAGVTFAKLDGTLQGRQTLAKITGIVGEMQREEVRRTKLGLPA